MVLLSKLERILWDVGDALNQLTILRLRLGVGNGKEWKKIILEYSSLPLFGSFNGGNRKSIPLFGSLSRRELNG